MNIRDSTNPLVVRGAAGLKWLNDRHPWSHNDHFHPWILRNLPVRRARALDVGCGRGELLVRLSPHFDRVHGTDLDATMRECAATRCEELPNVTVDDAQLVDLEEPFDLITMVAVLHHLDAAAALTEVRRLLAPGGRLLVVGLAPPVTPRDLAWDIASMLTNPVIGMVKHPRPVRDGGGPAPFPVADPTLGFDQLRALVAEVMPGAVMRHRIAFRHTIRWTKPSA